MRAGALVLLLAAFAPVGCDLVVGIKDVHESSPASSAVSGGGGAGAAGPACTFENAETNCGASTTCSAASCKNGACAHESAAIGTACSENQGTICDGKGQCVPVDPLENGKPCAAAAQCKSKACSDGVCCDAVCGGPCEACQKALTGKADGSCAKVAAGIPDPGSCDTGGCSGKACACASDGACRLADGQPCLVPAQCGSGFCADGVCCNTACSGGCAACAKALGAADDGSCNDHAIKNDIDPGVCDSANHEGLCIDAPCGCDGAGVCKGKKGSGCTPGNNLGCLTGFCVDAVCCDGPCNGACATCSVTLGAAMNGSCLAKAVKDMDDDACINGCANPPCTCDGAGLCKNKLGSMCTAPGDCASGKCCPDDTCCL